MYDYGMVPRLLLLSLHWGDDVDHAFPLCRDADLWPTMEVEVPDRPRLLLLWEEMQRQVRGHSPSEIWFMNSLWKMSGIGCVQTGTSNQAPEKRLGWKFVKCEMRGSKLITPNTSCSLHLFILTGKRDSCTEFESIVLDLVIHFG